MLLFSTVCACRRHLSERRHENDRLIKHRRAESAIVKVGVQIQDVSDRRVANQHSARARPRAHLFAARQAKEPVGGGVIVTALEAPLPVGTPIAIEAFSDVDGASDPEVFFCSPRTDWIHMHAVMSGCTSPDAPSISQSLSLIVGDTRTTAFSPSSDKPSIVDMHFSSAVRHTRDSSMMAVSRAAPVDSSMAFDADARDDVNT